MLKSIEVSPRSSLVLVHRSASSKLKRLFDIIGSFLGLFLLAIVFLPVAISIRLDTPGPILDRQVHCGLMGKLFTLYRFRSTVSERNSFNHFVKGEIDDFASDISRSYKITRVGRFLRKTGIESLPQFWNVFRGKMSLVGIKAPTPQQVQNYSVRHWMRLAVKPGITGRWRTSRYLEPRNNFELMVDLDIGEQEAWTPWHDLVIIAASLKIWLLKMLRIH